MPAAGSFITSILSSCVSLFAVCISTPPALSFLMLSSRTISCSLCMLFKLLEDIIYSLIERFNDIKKNISESISNAMNDFLHWGQIDHPDY